MAIPAPTVPGRLASEPPLFDFLSGRFATQDEAGPASVVVTLFTSQPGGLVKGWVAGPAARGRDGSRRRYVAPSEHVIGHLAILRARDLATELGCKVGLVDPDDLWPRMWATWTDPAPR